MSWFRSSRRDELDRNLAVLFLPSCFGGTLGYHLVFCCLFFSLLLGFDSYPEDLILAGISNFWNICLKFVQYKLYHVHLVVIKASV